MINSLKSQRKRAVVTAKVQSLQMTALCTNNDCQSAVTKPVVTVKVQSLSGAVKWQHLSRISYQAKAVGERDAGVGAGAPGPGRAAGDLRPADPGPSCSWYVTSDFGFRLCGRPSV